VFLVPARTDTRWFHDVVLPNAREIRFLRGRLKFGDAENSAPFPSMIVVFKERRRDGEERQASCKLDAVRQGMAEERAAGVQEAHAAGDIAGATEGARC
jgi:hypothetical protein